MRWCFSLGLLSRQNPFHVSARNSRRRSSHRRSIFLLPSGFARYSIAVFSGFPTNENLILKSNRCIPHHMEDAFTFKCCNFSSQQQKRRKECSCCIIGSRYSQLLSQYSQSKTGHGFCIIDSVTSLPRLTMETSVPFNPLKKRQHHF